MSNATLQILDAMLIVHHTEFPVLLDNLLAESQATKGELHNFLLKQGYEIDRSSIYRYFNPRPSTNRRPDKRFVELFAEFVGLNEVTSFALQQLWNIKRRKSSIE